MSVSEDRCLQCGESRESVKKHSYSCGIMSYGEYAELEEEFPRHRWADWSDAFLRRAGVLPEFFEMHRRTRITSLQWIPCEHTTRGHVIAATGDHEEDYGVPLGGCISCGAKVIHAGIYLGKYEPHPGRMWIGICWTCGDTDTLSTVPPNEDGVTPLIVSASKNLYVAAAKCRQHNAIKHKN